MTLLGGDSLIQLDSLGVPGVCSGRGVGATRSPERCTALQTRTGCRPSSPPPPPPPPPPGLDQEGVNQAYEE